MNRQTDGMLPFELLTPKSIGVVLRPRGAYVPSFKSLRLTYQKLLHRRTDERIDSLTDRVEHFYQELLHRRTDERIDSLTDRVGPSYQELLHRRTDERIDSLRIELDLSSRIITQKDGRTDRQSN
ncbi:hypothetical protein J6590_064718, partial [Homalodisca vitripennis]